MSGTTIWGNGAWSKEILSSFPMHVQPLQRRLHCFPVPPLSLSPSTQLDLAACCGLFPFRLNSEGPPLVSCSGCESSALVQKDIQAETPWQFVPPPSSFNTFITLALIGRSFQWMWGCWGEIIILLYRSNSFFFCPFPQMSVGRCGGGKKVTAALKYTS